MCVPDEWPSRRGNPPNRTRLTGRLVDKGRSFRVKLRPFFLSPGEWRRLAFRLGLEVKIALSRTGLAANWRVLVGFGPGTGCCLPVSATANPQVMGIEMVKIPLTPINFHVIP